MGTLTVYEHLWFNVSTSCLNSLWVESPKIYFRVGLTFIKMGFLGTKLKLIISKLYLGWGTIFKVVQKRLKRAQNTVYRRQMLTYKYGPRAEKVN